MREWLIIDNLVKTFKMGFFMRKKVVFDNFNFKFNGDILGVVGRNGVGKTTLLKLIKGFLKPNKGQIFLWDKPNSYWFDFINFSPENPSFYGDITLKDFLILNIVKKGLKSMPKELREIFFEFSLNQFLNFKIKELSYGTFKKAVILLSFLPPHKLILLDEPFSDIDEVGKNYLKKLILDKKHEIKFIITSHHREIIYEISDFILNLG